MSKLPPKWYSRIERELFRAGNNWLPVVWFVLVSLAVFLVFR